MATFCAALKCLSRKNRWKMNPNWELRSAAALRSGTRVMSRSPSRYRPPSGRSNRPIRLSSVLLPDPERPRMATLSPLWTVRSTPARMVRGRFWPFSVLVTPLSWTSG
jgi:hypothetical protein